MANHIAKRQTKEMQIGVVKIGGNNPVRIQSMTDTDTADHIATANQIMELVDAGSELVRITVNNKESAIAVPKIKNILISKNYGDVPLIGDFHYNGHTLLSEYRDCAEALDKYRINPGNVGFGQKQDKNFAQIIEKAVFHNKAVRIGVNWGSLDQDLVVKMMDENSKSQNPLSANDILKKCLILSAITSANKAIEYGLQDNKICISCKVSKVAELIDVYRELSRKTDLPLHLGLTEAGMGIKGIVASTAALSILLNEGIGDTIRISLTPEPGAKREKEVLVAQEILQSMGIRSFFPSVSSCPGCGRTTSSYFRELAEDIQTYIMRNMPVWSVKYPGVEKMNIAVMGCIVNGPGESKHANIGISLPGSGESPIAPVFIDGHKAHTLRGEGIAEEFKQILLNYIISKYS